MEAKLFRERKTDSKGELVVDRHPNSDKGGGWVYNNKDELNAQRGVMWDLMKQIGQNVMGSKDATSISMPVRVFEPRSYLQRAPDGWIHAPTFLSAAARESDPVERMRLVITFLLSGLINTCQVMAKPFNPILGETYQARFADGSMVFCEQSSHHPPVTMYQTFSSDGSWEYYGYGAWTASLRPNSIKGHQLGPNYVRFPKLAVEIKFTLPEAIVKGLMMGTRIIEYDGKVLFEDAKNDLACELQFNPAGQGFLSGLWGKKYPSDYVRGDIKRASTGEVLSTCNGSWLGAIEFDEKIYWDYRDEYPCDGAVKDAENPLPSDARFREDSSALAAKDLELAAEWKLKLEEKQRAERKLREVGHTERKASGETREVDMVTKASVLERQTKGILTGVESSSSSGTSSQKSKRSKKKKTKAAEEELDTGAD